MKNSLLEHVIRIPMSSTMHLADRSRRDLLMDHPHSNGSSRLKQNKVDSAMNKNNKSAERADSLAVRIRDHAGPIAGLLFISTDKVAFCSERSIKISSPTGELIRIHYKVSIPLRKIKTANESRNIERPSRKYLDIVTVDNFDFWFMGFLNYRKTFNYLQQAISQTQ
ncbi:hypothetical protein LguiB_025415 [Lonicera macranthoides]